MHGLLRSVRERAPSRARYSAHVIQDFWANAAFSITPTLMVGLIFWLVMFSIFRADRTERKKFSEMEAEERARRGLAPAAVVSTVRSDAPAETSTAESSDPSTSKD